MLRRSSLVAAVLLLISASAFAQGTVFLVRHAERADTAGGAPAMMATDPNLSDSGRARAKSLAAILKDSRISAIFVTEYKRTQETAAPIAKALGITPRVIAAKDTPALLASVRNHKGNVLVVGHSNSIPDVITGMGVKDAPVIADDEYDNLFIVTLPAALIHLHFR